MSEVTNCTVRELKERLDGGTAPVLLDVRQPEEIALCRIEGAVAIPMGEIPSRLMDLDRHADEEIIVYCHHGVRSASVQQFLLRNGFTNVRNLIGGIEEYALQVDPTIPRY